MKLVDPLYGTFEVEDVIAELIETDAIQRLKKIHQGGASYLINPKWCVNRYDHSVGVCLLIRKLGGSIEEQIAGLLHDISHTAFSHVVDYVLKNKQEDYHEEIFENILNQSEIPKVLSENGFHHKDILSRNWGILEQDFPDLCADRVDYTLRDMYTYGVISKKEVNTFLSTLLVSNGKICINSIESAGWFVSTYIKVVIDFFLNPYNVYGNQQFAQILQFSLESEIITLEDLQQDDESVLEMLWKNPNEKLKNLLQQLHPNVLVEDNEDEYDIHVRKKTRIVDPLVYIGGKTKRASEVSKTVRKQNKEALEKSLKGAFVKIINS
ncbi:HD domain-containing protein [Chengkuizengella axinellae]|uniref:HD domain-containing protein n=1 Tax=Chengkuizengella axinellae TaxID=3064388 RepID=A0ABT9J1D7_9BACL|nr:HD domain-containing protein [Chengkuizengella sp. 2205SS18-9]MDP5275425.1 HD domain-containing protein [Chengkuizengella sp. 2205SS18-9]